MRKELEKYGIQIPAFSKIGGILANELSVDEAACKWLELCIIYIYVHIHRRNICFYKYKCFSLSDLDVSAVHAAIFAINEAIDKRNAESTMVALQNPNALLRNTQKPLAEAYQDTLSKAKKRKDNQASARVI